MLKELLITLFLSHTPHYTDQETWSEREARAEVMADAIDNAAARATCTGEYADKKDTPKEQRCVRIWPAPKKDLAILMLTMAKFESTFSERIHKNECNLHKGECDAGRAWDGKSGKYSYYQKAWTPWQLHRFLDIPQEDWDQIASGIPGTRMAAWYATKRFSAAFRACGTYEGAYSRYGRGNGCRPIKTAPDRVATFVKLQKLSQWELDRRVAKQREAVEKKFPEPEPVPPEEAPEERLAIKS